MPREDAYPNKGDYTAIDSQGIAEIIIGKQRNGPTGTVELRFVPSSMRFDNLYRGE